MRKLSKIVRFWLIRANLVIFILIFAFNMPIVVSLINMNWQVNSGLAPQNLFAGLIITGSDSLLVINAPLAPQTMRVILTAYSSTSDQTDSTPFITASNTRVRDGVIASNFLAFGTKVQVPALFGDKIFTVEDRMAKKHNDKIDIWFPERHLAKRFGIQEAEVVILQ